MIRMTLLAAASALALAACGQSTQVAETPPPPATPIQAPPAETALTDAQFVQVVANSDAFEIQASQLAVAQAPRADVKAFARTMVDGHTATTEQLTALAPTIGVNTPRPVIESGMQAKLDRIRGLTGAEFEDAYLDEQVAAHEAAVQAFQNYIRTAQAGPLRDWASTTLPTLQMHLTTVQALENAT